MPNVPITTSPTRISQTVTQQANLQNTGNVTVYLDSHSAVSHFAYGLAVSPRASVNWPADSELWAVTESDDGVLSVLYGADGVSVSEVSAVVTGDVTAVIEGPVDATITGPVTVSGTVTVGGIDTPVMVQGGGEILYVGSGSVAGSTGVSLNIPAPASGLTYFGLRVFISHNGPTLAEPLEFSIESNGAGFASSPSIAVASLGAGGLILGSFGNAGQAEFIVPMAAQYPIRVFLSNRSPSACNYSLQVNGISHSEPRATDASVWTNSVETRTAFSGAAAGSYAIIAASFEDRKFLITTSTGTAGSFVVDELDSSFSTWSTTQERAQNSVYQSATPLTSGIQAETNSVVFIPGTGQLHRIRNTNAVVGNTFLSYLGKA